MQDSYPIVDPIIAPEPVTPGHDVYMELHPDGGKKSASAKPTVTLATLKPSDNLSTLVARVGTYPKVAAS